MFQPFSTHQACARQPASNRWIEHAASEANKQPFVDGCMESLDNLRLLEAFDTQKKGNRRDSALRLCTSVSCKCWSHAVVFGIDAFCEAVEE